jgi:predicted RNase H-like nuclease (RuvC/YqgF family)
MEVFLDERDALRAENETLKVQVASANQSREYAWRGHDDLGKIISELRAELAQAKAEIESLETANLPLYSDRIKDLEKNLEKAKAEVERLNKLYADCQGCNG